MSQITKTTTLLVIGGGPGGYVAAIRAAQHGLTVALVEKERPGGVERHRCVLVNSHDATMRHLSRTCDALSTALWITRRSGGRQEPHTCGVLTSDRAQDGATSPHVWGCC